MRVGIIGGGTIARLLLEHMRSGDLGAIEVVAIVGRSTASRGQALAAQFGVPFVTDIDALLARKPDVVVEAASHEAVHAYGPRLLSSGVTLIVLSGGALADDALRTTLEEHRGAARRVALRSLRRESAGWTRSKRPASPVSRKSAIAVTKPAIAWKGIRLRGAAGYRPRPFERPRRPCMTGRHAPACLTSPPT